MKPALAGVVVLAVLAMGAGADEVHLTNGDRMSGTVVGAPAGHVAIDMPGIGVVTVPEELVASVVREEPPEPSATWVTSADVGVLLSTGNSRARDATVVLSGKRAAGSLRAALRHFAGALRGQRFDGQHLRHGVPPHPHPRSA